MTNHNRSLLVFASTLYISMYISLTIDFHDLERKCYIHFKVANEFTGPDSN